MMFTFIAKHRGIWRVEWLCGALGVSRGGFYAWLTRPRSRRSHSDEELGAKVRASFIASDRTYGARRVWHDMIEDGVSCGLQRQQHDPLRGHEPGPDHGAVLRPRTVLRCEHGDVHQPRPAGPVGRRNMYQYCGGNATGQIDPSGMDGVYSQNVVGYWNGGEPSFSGGTGLVNPADRRHALRRSGQRTHQLFGPPLRRLGAAVPA